MGEDSKQVDEARELQSLDAVLRWAITQTPKVVPVDVVIQDEYTHDVIFRLDDVRYLVFDSS